MSISSRFRVFAFLVVVLVLSMPRGARALLYEDLDVLYSENFDDELAVMSLVPEVDVLGAGHLHEANLGNGPFTPVSLETAPLIPRDAARATVTNTHAASPNREEAKHLIYYAPSLPGTGDVAVRGNFADLEIGPSDVTYNLQPLVSVAAPGGKYVTAALIVVSGESPPGPRALFTVGESSALPASGSGIMVPAPADVLPAILAGSPFQITLVVDRTGGVVTGELVVGATVFTVGPMALSIVMPTDSLPIVTIGFQNLNFSLPTVYTAVRDTGAVNFDSIEVRGTAPGVDTDGDGMPDANDACPFDVQNDVDGDGVCESLDNCDATPNPDQADLDGDNTGDPCDPDADGDGQPSVTDNCPFDVNPGQADTDGDGAGDLCDSDSDGDGVIDADDACLPSPIGEPVNPHGCALAEICPCAHPQGEDRWKNHGAYVSCVAHAANEFRIAGVISTAEHDALVAAAGQSSCGAKR